MDHSGKYMVVKYLGKAKSMVGWAVREEGRTYIRLPLMESAFNTCADKGVNVKLTYDDLEEALNVCDELNKVNPKGFYDIGVVQ